MDELQNGHREMGDGLVDNDRTVSPSISTEKAVPSADLTPSVTVTARAKRRLDQCGTDYISKSGDSVLHEALRQTDSASMVHVCAQAGIGINAQNFDGDTPLHLAVQRGHVTAARALLMNGADVTQRNKLGQTPLDQSQGIVKDILESYQPGLTAALTKGSKAAMQRIMRLWPNPNAFIKPGTTALEFAKSNCCKGANFQACYNLLKETVQTMRLVHAVLSEDIEGLKELLQTDAAWNVNVRYQDKFGETPLSAAIDLRSLELVQLLLGTGKCATNIRVRESVTRQETVPLYFKTLEADCPEEIWKYVLNNSPGLSHTDRDCCGNTSLIRAIQNGKSAKFIHALLSATGGVDITCRNAEGVHARELAQSREMLDIVETIDQFICDHPRNLLMTLPVACYGKEHLDISNKQGKSLLDAALANGSHHDITAVKQYSKIEALGRRLFRAAQTGNFKEAAKLNTANYQDKDGSSALIHAIVFNQPQTAEILLSSRPALCGLSDNCGRLPLHFAYALPEGQGEVFINLLLERPRPWANTEHAMDKAGREPADYRSLRATPDVLDMLHAVRSSNVHAKDGESTCASSQLTENGG